MMGASICAYWMKMLPQFIMNYSLHFGSYFFSMAVYLLLQSIMTKDWELNSVWFVSVWKNGITSRQCKTDMFVLRMELLQFSWQHKEDIWMSFDCCFLQEQRLTSHDRYDQHFRAELGSNFTVMKISTGIFFRQWVHVEVFHWKAICGCDNILCSSWDR